MLGRRFEPLGRKQNCVEVNFSYALAEWENLEVRAFAHERHASKDLRHPLKLL